jgi:tetratricopeptide (TPR) repeat protein
MPVLPSGKSITLIPQIRLLNAIESPPRSGYFWIDSPADQPDFGMLPEMTTTRGSYMQVPLPESLDDFKKYITVQVSDENGGLENLKINLIDFPPKGYLSETDEDIWKKWLNSEPVQLFLEMHMAECFDQVEYFSRLKKLGLIDKRNKSTSPEIAGGFDLFLEREPLEEKKLRHARYFKRAEEYLVRLKNMRVKDPLVQITWVDLSMEEFILLKDWKGGEEFFQKQYAAYPEQIEFHLAFLKCLYEQSRYADVEEALWKAVAQYPQKTEYWNLLIQVYLNQQWYVKALEIINMALVINTDNRELLENKFMCENAIRKMTKK